jgi:hypothetical protein
MPSMKGDYMKKSSTLWQGFLVAGITALAVPTFVHGQTAAGAGAGAAGSSGMTAGSPATSGTTGSSTTTGSRSGMSDSTLGTTPGTTGTQGTTGTSSSPNNNLTSSSPGSMNRDMGTSTSDQNLNTQIRQALNADSSLSGVGRNVTLTTNNGKVTLNGSVASEGDKLKIEQKVKQMSGVENVNNELQVVSSSRSSSMGTNR